MKTIKFTNGECVALLHRLYLWDCLFEVFNDTTGLEHLADRVVARTQELVRSLESSRTVIVDENSELDCELMKEAVEGSTWVAIHDPYNDTNNTHQGCTAAYYALDRAAAKIADAFGIDKDDIEVPKG